MGTDYTVQSGEESSVKSPVIVRERLSIDSFTVKKLTFSKVCYYFHIVRVTVSISTVRYYMLLTGLLD